MLLNPQWLPTYVEAVGICHAKGEALDPAGPLMSNATPTVDEWARRCGKAITCIGSVAASLSPC